MKYSGNVALLKNSENASGGGSSAPTYVAGNNIQIENNNVISTTDDLVVDSINLNGNDLHNTLVNVNSELSTHTNNINSLQTEIGTLNTNLATQVQTLNTEIANNNSAIAHINEYINNGYILKYLGEWNSTASYKMYEYVSYNDKSYIALRDNINQVPDANPDDWKETNITQSIDLSDYYEKVGQVIIDSGGINSIRYMLHGTETLFVGAGTTSVADQSYLTVNNVLSNNTAQFSALNQVQVPNKTQVISYVNDEITTLRAELMDICNRLDRRLVLLENEWVVKNSVEYLIVRTKFNDNNIQVQVMSTLKTPITSGVSGNCNLKYINGYTDVGDTSSHVGPYMYTATLTNGACAFNVSANTQYVNAYQYFLLGVSFTYNNKTYGCNIPVYLAPYSDYDYSPVSNWQYHIAM